MHDLTHPASQPHPLPTLAILTSSSLSSLQGSLTEQGFANLVPYVRNTLPPSSSPS